MEKQNIGHYLRVKEAAEYLGVGKSTIWLFTKQGKIKAIRMSERVTVWARAELDAFIASKITAGAASA
jgi:excisionase family DNA binding protein